MSGSIPRYSPTPDVRPSNHLYPSISLPLAYPRPIRILPCPLSHTLTLPYPQTHLPILLPSANVSVHDGFGKAQARTAQTVLSTVQSGLSTYNVSKVLITGHSLGAAIATMDAVMLRMQLPSAVEMNTVVFGAPRGGNEAWADLVDATVSHNFPTSFH